MTRGHAGACEGHVSAPRADARRRADVRRLADALGRLRPRAELSF